LLGTRDRTVKSTVDGWDLGQAARGGLGVQTLVTISADHLGEIDESLGSLSSYLARSGRPTRVTAGIGMHCAAKPKPGDPFAVSAAAGAVDGRALRPRSEGRAGRKSGEQWKRDEQTRGRGTTAGRRARGR